MKNIIFILLLLSFSFCKIEDKRNILGNWYFESEMDYTEVFFNKNTFELYSFSGDRSTYKYSLKNDTIILRNGDFLKKITFIILDNNMVLLNHNNTQIDTLRRIEETEYTLENYYIDGDFQKYLDAFHDRMGKMNILNKMPLFDKK